MIGSLVLLVVLGVAALCFSWVRSVRRRLPESDHDWLPTELRGTELVWSEKVFRAEGPAPVSARIDRAYLLPGGELVLVEFKRRAQRRVYLSDVVELSAQRYAVQHAGHVVSRRGYVVAILPDGICTSAVAVELEDAAQVELRATRLQALVERRLAPRGARHASLCASCAHKGGCSLQTR